MMNGFGFGFGPVGWIFMILFWVVLIVGAVWLTRSVFSGWTNQQTRRTEPDLDAREILDRRYARGEIDRDEYELMKKDLSKDS